MSLLVPLLITVMGGVWEKEEVLCAEDEESEELERLLDDSDEGAE